MDENEKQSSQTLEQILRKEAIKRKKFLEKFPQDVPNDVCNHAFIRGFSIENSFMPEIGEYNYLFETEFESISVWTYKSETNSCLVSKVKPEVKELPYWKTVAYLIEMSLTYQNQFSPWWSDTEHPDYKWMYYFSPTNSTIENTTIYNLSEDEAKNISNGVVIKATGIAELSPLIELLLRDDRAYTAISLLASSFQVHFCCLVCELSPHPFHDHLSEEPYIWQHAGILQKLEMCVVQCCRTVESIIGVPPNKNKYGKVYQFKEKWKANIGMDPESIFEKTNQSFLDFYYELYFSLRNPSAHSYGNIHYDLAREKAVASQCFAALILQKYIENNLLDKENALTTLRFNKEFLSRSSGER